MVKVYKVYQKLNINYHHVKLLSIVTLFLCIFVCFLYVYFCEVLHKTGLIF